MASRPVVNLTQARAQAHRIVLQLTGGRFFAHLGGMPVIVLTTTGRRTGRWRSVALNAPLAIGDRLIVVASDGGSPTDPAWFRNLSRFPEVTVLSARRKQRMRARVATATEKEELWPRVVAQNDVYAAYQRRTPRDIPLVWLEPSEH
jgi:deazaflavin-dependent oxidoreductase (nitroreductase family)